MIWVLVHNAGGMSTTCADNNAHWGNFEMGWRSIAVAGDLGVDMFFVLSGFLISYILIKEHDKYGQIDTCNFYRGRCLRLWPSLLVYEIVAMIYYQTITSEGIWRSLFFVGNDYRHTWTVSTEFQFYILSPFIVRHMLWSKYPWLLPSLIFIFHIIMGFVMIRVYCPEMMRQYPNPCGSMWTEWYKNIACRIGVYACGVWAGYFHMRGDKAKWLSNSYWSAFLEYCCLLGILYMSYFGAKF